MSPQDGLCKKNYETVSIFDKLMQKKLWPFFGTRCSCTTTTATVFSELHDQLVNLERHDVADALFVCGT